MQNMLKNFEKSIEELETIIEHLESGDLSLEASLKQFEKGINLTKQCEKALNQAEQKIKILTKDETLAEFDSDNLSE